MTGFTIYEPLGIKTEFVHIDLERRQVEAIVLYHQKIIMTIKVNLREKTVHKTGGFDEFPRIKEMGIIEQDTILEIERLSQFYVENGITNPKEYLGPIN